MKIITGKTPYETKVLDDNDVEIQHLTRVLFEAEPHSTELTLVYQIPCFIIEHDGTTRGAFDIDATMDILRMCSRDAVLELKEAIDQELSQ